MDIIDKQQRIDSIRDIVKARWINIVLIVALGLTLKIKYFTGEWASGFEYFKIIMMGVFVSGYNFAFWLFIRRSQEKIGNRSLAIVAALQVILDQITYTLIFFYTGTVETIAFILYFLTILIASSLYKAKGIILTALLAVCLHNGVLIAELKGSIPHLTGYPGTVWFGNPFVSRGKIIGFTFYMAAAVVFSSILSNLFRKREKTLREQKDQLSVKTKALTGLTKELGEAKTSLEIKVNERTQQLKSLTENLEEKVKERTGELQSKIEEMEKFQRLTIGREVSMVELKKEMKKLKEELKKYKDEE